MTDDKSYPEELKSFSNSYVTFDDGARGRIKSICKLVSLGFLCLYDMLLVEGLIVNLINISQLYDQDLDVNFNKFECIVSNKDQKVLRKGTRSKDNCYLWIYQNKSQPLTCLISKIDETKLWHQKLGDLDLKSMRKIISEDDVRGLPNLNIEEGKICGECQIVNQIKISHKKLQRLPTTKVLELAHMDLTGPMHFESLGGKRYVFVCLDDFSWNTWAKFIKELCNNFKEEKGVG